MSNLSRRRFLRHVGGAAACTTFATRALASLSIGRGTLQTVSDGHLVLPKNFAFSNLPSKDVEFVTEKYDLAGSTLEPSCNVTVYQDGQNVVLFDVGAGPDFMPTAGRLIDNLAALNLTPEDVTHVVFTHAHPDHLWGLLDDFDDPMFANATHLMGRAEWDYWWNPETINTIGEQRVTFAAGAHRRLKTMEDLFERFDDGQEILSGIASVATPGHTPGHMSFEVRSGSQAALIIGDAIVNHHLAFHNPAWHSTSDQDPELGAQTRVALFDRVLKDDLTVIGFHFPEGGMGRVERSGKGLTFLGENT